MWLQVSSMELISPWSWFDHVVVGASAWLWKGSRAVWLHVS